MHDYGATNKHRMTKSFVCADNMIKFRSRLYIT